jgi:hypothetical protein
MLVLVQKELIIRGWFWGLQFKNKEMLGVFKKVED